MPFEKIKSSVGLNIATIEKRHGVFKFLDVSGIPVMRKIWDKYFSECNGLIFVIDGADSSRFEEVKDTINRLYDQDNPTDLVDIPLLVLLNKRDN